MIKGIALHEAIVDGIKKYIVDNQLNPGDRLPNQQKLTEILGVSRTSLRESLRTLQALDILDIQNGRGIFVNKPSVTTLKVEINIENERKTLLDLIEFRMAVEGLAVRLAAERATTEEIAEMEKVLDIMKEKAAKGEENAEADRIFHFSIYKASKNSFVMQMTQSMYENLNYAWENPLGMGKAPTGIAWHIELFNAIKTRNPKKAEKAFTKFMEEMTILAKNV